VSSVIVGSFPVRSQPPLTRRSDAKPRPLGPALKRRRFPVAAVTVSTLGHAVLLGAIVALFLWGNLNSSKVHVVNLVPSIAAVGQPSAPPAPPVPVPSRPTAPEPAPRDAKSREPIELPKRAEPPPPREPVQLPSASLPTPPRPAALPRPGEKELPSVAAPPERRPLPPAPTATARAERAAEPRPAPPAPPGQATGSVTGSGPLSLDVSDFPHAWYLRQILQKVQDRWQRQTMTNEPEQKPLVFVEIQRDGSIRTPTVEKSSGNAFYDQAALRAIVEASPFPPLPEDWKKPSLRVIFRFDLQRERG
jgi:TonB family protein